MEFEVGDTVRCIDAQNAHWCYGKFADSSSYGIGRTAMVTGIEQGMLKLENGELYNPEAFEVVKPEYNKLKQRIEGLKNGWNKEAADILQEVKGKHSFIVWISSSGLQSSIRVYSGMPVVIDWAGGGNDGKLEAAFKFSFLSQCEEMTAFKSALLWLLDHSSIKKDEKQEKLTALETQLKDIQKQIEELK